MKKQTPNSQQGAFACASESFIKEGLTKREYFAGLAMQGLLASFTEKAAIGAWENELPETAVAAVKMADALLEQLKN